MFEDGVLGELEQVASAYDFEPVCFPFLWIEVLDASTEFFDEGGIGGVEDLFGDFGIVE